MKRYKFISNGSQRYVYDTSTKTLYDNREGVLTKCKFDLIGLSRFCPYAEVYDESDELPKS